MRDTYNRSVEETEMEVLKPLLDADLLVLDDLGAERTSEWVQETLGLVVNTRYNAKRPTIFTSNLVDVPDNTDPRSFIFQLGARTRSRLIEMCDWVEIQGADIREVGADASPRRHRALEGDLARLTRKRRQGRQAPAPRPHPGPRPAAAGQGRLRPEMDGREGGILKADSHTFKVESSP